MATVRKEITLEARPADVWDALRDFGALHEKLVPGFVVDAHVDGDTRVITFFDGVVAHERLVTADDDERRMVYTVTQSPLGLEHHSASAQAIALDDGRTRLVWITDLLPDSAAAVIEARMERGIAAIRDALEPVVTTS